MYGASQKLMIMNAKCCWDLCYAYILHNAVQCKSQATEASYKQIRWFLSVEEKIHFILYIKPWKWLKLVLPELCPYFLNVTLCLFLLWVSLSFENKLGCCLSCSCWSFYILGLIGKGTDKSLELEVLKIWCINSNDTIWSLITHACNGCAIFSASLCIALLATHYWVGRMTFFTFLFFLMISGQAFSVRCSHDQLPNFKPQNLF